MKVTKEELNEFTHERFNGHFHNLIAVGLSSGCENDLMYTLSFITDLQILVEISRVKAMPKDRQAIKTPARVNPCLTGRKVLHSRQ